MGEVFAAWDPLLGREVALKLITGGGAMALLRFVREAELQARVDHPNICRILDVDLEDDLPFIAMQRVRGPSMDYAQLDPMQAVAVMGKVAEAVHAAHRLNLIHRDLKPGNILLEANEAGHWTPYVCDFGLAKELGSATLTQAHGSPGTPAFMAPEQAGLLEAPVGPAADLYGLGATLFYALTQEPPPRPRPHREPALPAHLPEDLRHILSRCLAWEPEDRYPTAAALAEDLRRFQDGEPLAVAASRPWVRCQRAVRRRPWTSASALALVLLCLALGALALRTQRRTLAQAHFAEVFMVRVKDMEYRMRVERMLPAHDLRPALGRVAGELAAVRQAMAQGGSLAAGPGSLALGWGHVLLRQPREALAALQPAWDQGYRTPKMAFVLARAHCDAFEDGLPAARAEGGAALETLKRRHLGPARQFLALADSAGLEPAALGLARLETLDGHPELALKLANAAFQQDPANYEAKAWAAEALVGLGYGLQLGGDDLGAEGYYRQSDTAARLAEAIGRSDEWALKVQLNRHLATMTRSGGPSLSFQALQDLADRLLALNPDWLPAIADRLTVAWRKGEAAAEHGQDPGREVAQGWSLLEAATRRLPGAGARLQRDRLNLARVQAEYDFNQGRNPCPWVAKGLAGSRDDEYAAELLILRARWKLRRRQDPTEDLDRAVAGCQRPSFEGVATAATLGTEGDAWLIKARWALATREDARPALDRAGAVYARAEALNPVNRYIQQGLATLASLNRQAGRSY